MKIKCIRETDSLYIELCLTDVDKPRDLDESTHLDMDAGERFCTITIEHASDRMPIVSMSYERSFTCLGGVVKVRVR